MSQKQEFTGKQAAVVIALFVVGGLIYGMCDFKRTNNTTPSASRVSEPHAAPSPGPTPPQPPPGSRESTKAEIPPLPGRIDFAKLFTLKRGDAIAMLGQPIPGEEEFKLGESIKISLEYRDGLVSRAFVASDIFPSPILLKWIGDNDPAAIHLDVATPDESVPGLLWVNSKRLPRKRLDAKKILGRTRSHVMRYLGPADVGEGTWTRDGYMVSVMFDDADTVRYLDVSFDPGIRPDERQEEMRTWMRLPSSGDVVVRGRRFVPRLNHISIVWERRYP